MPGCERTGTESEDMDGFRAYSFKHFFYSVLLTKNNKKKDTQKSRLLEMPLIMKVLTVMIFKLLIAQLHS